MNNPGQKELSLLLAACLDIPGKPDLGDVNSRHLHQLMCYHGMRPLFLSFLHKWQVEVDFQKSLRNDCQEIAFLNMLSTHELIKVNDLLVKRGIKCYAYKGSLWADWLYGDISQREFGDIDLLIPRDVFPKAINLLSSEAGFHAEDYQAYLMGNPVTRESFFETDYHIPMTKERGESASTILEAHWAIAYPRLLFHFPSSEWERYSETYIIQNKQLTSFTREYQFLILLVHHGGKEQWKKLKYIGDLSAYMRRLGHETDWDLVIRLAKDKGIYSLVKYSLGLLKALGMPWQPSWPQDIIEIDAGPFKTEWNEMPRQASNSTWPYFKHGLSMRDGILQKWRLIASHLQYFSEFKLLWHKASWYKKNRA